MSGTELFLVDSEISELTNKTYAPARIKALNALGIQHKVRGDGSIAILRAHIIKVFGGNPETPSRKSKDAEPNWSAI